MAKNKKILLHNKFYKLDQKIGRDYCYNNGEILHADRLYTIIDQVLTLQVKVKNWFLSFLLNYWFFNNDFQKQKSMSKKTINKSRLFINIVFLISLIALIICLILGLAIPIIQSTTDSLKLLNGKFQGNLISNGKIIGFVINQSNVTNVVNEVQSILNSAKADVSILDQTSNLWLKYFLEKYYMGKHSISTTDLLGAVNHLSAYLSMHAQSSPINFVFFESELQNLIYFRLVNSTIITSSSSIDLNNILNSFNGSIFTLLPSTNVFYGLRSNSICLNDNQASQAMLVPVIWATWFSNANVIIPLCFTLFLIFIIWFHSRTIKKNKPKYTNMTMYNFIANKVTFIKKFKFLLKRLIFLDPNIDELKHNFILGFDNLDKTTIYNTLRLLNYSYSVLESMDIVLVLNYSDEVLKIYQSLIKDDSHNLAITIIDEEELQPLLDSSKSSNKVKGFSIVNDIDSKEMIYSQYKNYLKSYLSFWQDDNEFLIFYKSKLNLIKKTNQYKLTPEQESKLIEEITSGKNKLTNNQIWNKTKISFKSFSPEINNLITKIVDYENKNS